MWSNDCMDEQPLDILIIDYDLKTNFIAFAQKYQ